VAAISIASGVLTFGTGYRQAHGTIEGTPLPAFFFLEIRGRRADDGVWHSGRHLRAVACGGRRLGSTLGLVLGANTGLAARCSAWPAISPCRAGADDGHCHHPRNDRQTWSEAP
jgi:hypothetical protein